MDLAEAERLDGGLRMMAEYPQHVARFIRVLSKAGVSTTETEVAKLWWEFSMWWAAEWLYPPRSDKELLHILLRGLRRLPRSERDWDLKCLHDYDVPLGNCSAFPVRWDVTPDEFDLAVSRLLPCHQLDRRKACTFIAQRHFVSRIEQCPENKSDLAKVCLVASAYFYPVGRVGPDGYPR
ncbi:hypothetical protein [Pseudomonas sp. UMAB-40]|uniref:hypothetical protein n=1 Tax=Pseudomonas sp. UMAB-40 TaxID=1365407 RepID=UPI001C562145|nr:hypothetical protein [Pseudomonas sp. UMAB-40]